MQKAGICLALMALYALGGCASVETRGLPKCSGAERRPLNGDLWQWADQKPIAVSPRPTTAPELPAPSGGLVRKAAADLPLSVPTSPPELMSYAPSDRGAGGPFDTTVTPHWNIEGSYGDCESDDGTDT